MDRCENCEHFDPESTELPICLLHKKLVREDWTCGDFSKGE